MLIEDHLRCFVLTPVRHPRPPNENGILVFAKCDTQWLQLQGLRKYPTHVYGLLNRKEMDGAGWNCTNAEILFPPSIFTVK